MSTLKNGEFGIDLDKEKILWTDRKRHTIFSLPLSFTKYTLTETKLIIQRGCFNLRQNRSHEGGRRAGGRQRRFAGAARSQHRPG